MSAHDQFTPLISDMGMQKWANAYTYTCTNTSTHTDKEPPLLRSIGWLLCAIVDHNGWWAKSQHGESDGRDSPCCDYAHYLQYYDQPPLPCCSATRAQHLASAATSLHHWLWALSAAILVSFWVGCTQRQEMSWDGAFLRCISRLLASSVTQSGSLDLRAGGKLTGLLDGGFESVPESWQ